MNQNSTRKITAASATFKVTKRSHSMEPPITTSRPPPARSLSTTIEFPTANTSPPQAEEESRNNSIVHYSHSQHRLSHVTSLDPFTCSGCKEKGAGKRFACQQCDFQLHEFCALSPPALKTHPLHSQHQLILHSKPKPGGILWPRCDVCGKGTKGFTFRCGACNFQMHPCCAMLSNEMNFSAVHPHLLKLLPQYPHHQYPTTASTSTSSGAGAGAAEISGMCGECKRKRSGRVYRCTTCDYHLHAVCAKNMINGLKANGINLSPDKPSMLGPAARLASQVVIEFIGGLFEGFGEAVGQALLQNIARSGRRNSRTRRSSIDGTNK